MLALSVRLRCPTALLLLALAALPAAASAQSPARRDTALRLYPLDAYGDDLPDRLRRPVSLEAERMPLDAVLRAIGEEAGLAVVFDTDRAAAEAPRTMTLDDTPAAEAFRRALEGTGLAAYLTPDWKVMIASTDDERAAPRRPQGRQGQTVRGQVVERRTQQPLPGANVVVLGTDPVLGTSTDADGRFVLRDVPLGRHDIRVSFVGYETATLEEVLVTSGKEVVLRVALHEQVLAGGNLVITPDWRKDRPLNEMAVVSARSFSVEETRRYAGGVDDPARMASAFAGVTAGMGVETNALTIRGNAPKGVQWRLEGVEIPNPNHFAGLNVAGGGGVTLFSSQLLDDSDFLTGAFPAEYGNALAGVFDMRFRSGNPTQREHTFQAGLLGIEVASEGPFDRDGTSAYLFNYRYSTLGLLLPLLPTEDVARYQDLSFNLSFPTRRWGRFEVWGLGGLDGQTMAEESDSSRWEYEIWDRTNMDLRLGVGATGLNHHLAVGPQSYLRTTAAFTINRTRWDQRRLSDELVLEDNLFVHATNSRAILSSYLNHTFGARHVNRTGVTVQQLFYDFNLRAVPDDTPPVVPIARGDGQSTLLQLYTQSQLDLAPRLTLGAGLHAQYFALTEAASAEPRASLRWQFADDQALSLGYGLHSQIEDLRIYFAQPPGTDSPRQPNRDLALAKAHHGVLGYDRQLGASARLKLEVYYQSLFDVPVIADSSYSMLNFEQDWTFRDPLESTGAGRNYGVELTLERFLDGGYYYLVTGSLFRSRYRGGDGVWRDTRFDRRFTANALFGKEFTLGDRNNLLGVNGRLSLLGGTRYSPVDHAASRAREEVVFDAARAFARKKPPLLLLDLTLTYRRNHDRFSSVWALQVKNALGAQETILDYNFATERVEEVKEGFPLPVLSYKIEF